MHEGRDLLHGLYGQHLPNQHRHVPEPLDAFLVGLVALGKRADQLLAFDEGELSGMVLQELWLDFLEVSQR